MQDHQEWIDCFKINGDTYELTICPCHHPSIVCRAMDDDAAHNRTTSKQVQDMITIFKLKMGAQRATADVAEQAAEVEQQPPPPPVVQMQQLDGTASSTPSRSNASPQAYDEDDGFYGDDQSQGRQRRPQGRPKGKADKVPIWKGSSAER